MKSAAVAIVVLLSTAGVRAQERREHGSAPPAPSVPKTLSTGGITTLPPPPPPSPFAARPDTYFPRYGQTSPFRAGRGNGVSNYNGTLGFFPYATPMAPVPDQKPAPAAPALEPPTSQPLPEPPKTSEPVPEPPRVAASHGPDTFYVIPGCYAGNRPPNPERLPKGCDVSRMRTTPVR
jgi:hypothetical protein